MGLPATFIQQKILQDQELMQLVHGQLNSFSFCDAELQRSMNRTRELGNTLQKWEALHGRCSLASRLESWERVYIVWDNGIYIYIMIYGRRYTQYVSYI